MGKNEILYSRQENETKQQQNNPQNTGSIQLLEEARTKHSTSRHQILAFSRWSLEPGVSFPRMQMCAQVSGTQCSDNGGEEVVSRGAIRFG